MSEVRFIFLKFLDFLFFFLVCPHLTYENFMLKKQSSAILSPFQSSIKVFPNFPHFSSTTKKHLMFILIKHKILVERKVKKIESSKLSKFSISLLHHTLLQMLACWLENLKLKPSSAKQRKMLQGN